MAATETYTPTTEEWLYAGQRLDAKDKPIDVWVDLTGTERSFTKLTGSMPGHSYSVEVVRRDGDGDSKLSVMGTPRYLGGDQATRRATDAQLERWRAEHHAARQTLEAKRAEKAASADDELQAALEVIRRHRHRIKAYAKRGAFDSYVLGELGRPPAKPKEED